MTLDEMKEMELNQFRKLPNMLWVLRVPNGWIYYAPDAEVGTFVPELTIIQEHIVGR